MSDKPKTAYDLRRYLALVQVLALDDRLKVHKGILHLCESWDIEPVWKTGTTYPSVDIEGTLQKLAAHVVDYHSSKPKEKRTINRFVGSETVDDYIIAFDYFIASDDFQAHITHKVKVLAINIRAKDIFEARHKAYLKIEELKESESNE